MGVDFSVVIPTLGRASLQRAVTSVLTQSLPPAEVIVVDNGPGGIDEDLASPPDQPPHPCPVRIISLPPLSGPSICRNVGAHEANTTFVAFLDDDDEFAPDYLERMAGRIERTGAPILYGAKVWRTREGAVRREKRLSTVPPRDWLDRLYQHENPGFGGQNLVIDRTVFFALGGFAVDLPSGEDRAFAMAALRATHHIEYVDEAEVICHDPDGIRARGRPDKWLTDLKLMHTYWGEVGWATRLRSLARWVRKVRRTVVRARRSAVRGRE